jgi:hypothetical protein
MIFLQVEEMFTETMLCLSVTKSAVPALYLSTISDSSFFTIWSNLRQLSSESDDERLDSTTCALSLNTNLSSQLLHFLMYTGLSISFEVSVSFQASDNLRYFTCISVNLISWTSLLNSGLSIVLGSSEWALINSGL